MGFLAMRPEVVDRPDPLFIRRSNSYDIRTIDFVGLVGARGTYEILDVLYPETMIRLAWQQGHRIRDDLPAIVAD